MIMCNDNVLGFSDDNVDQDVMKSESSVFFFQAEDGIRDGRVTGVQTCALPISWRFALTSSADTIAGVVIEALESKPSRLYRSVLRRYRWDVIVDRQILPLLQRAESAGRARNRRSEERRVGKECRYRGARWRENK